MIIIRLIYPKRVYGAYYMPKVGKNAYNRISIIGLISRKRAA